MCQFYKNPVPVFLDFISNRSLNWLLSFAKMSLFLTLFFYSFAESPMAPERLVVVAVYPFTAIEPGDLSLGMLLLAMAIYPLTAFEPGDLSLGMLLEVVAVYPFTAIEPGDHSLGMLPVLEVVAVYPFTAIEPGDLSLGTVSYK
jgi:hypothetical protein